VIVAADRERLLTFASLSPTRTTKSRAAFITITRRQRSLQTDRSGRHSWGARRSSRSI